MAFPFFSNFGSGGMVTSNMDWCEENYAVTPYIAEFFNTLSSIPVMLFGLHGFLHIMKDYFADYTFFDRYSKLLRIERRRKNNKTNNHKLGLVNAALHFMCMIVGLGSILFHSTLSWEGQALDELPMLWVSSLCLFAIHRISGKEKKAQGPSPQLLLQDPSIQFGVFLLIVNVLITYAYFMQGFLLFFVTYSVTIATMLTLSIRFVNRSQQNLSESDKNIIMWQKRILYTAGAVYVGGFLLLWCPEMIFCGNRKQSFHDSIFTSLHLHAFFHLTSACGSYSFCVFASLADNALDEDKKDSVGIVNEASWSTMYIPLPKVVVK